MATQPDKAAGHQRHLRNYLINKKLQLHITWIIVTISAMLTTGLGWVVMRKAREASRVVQIRAMDPDDQLAQQLVGQFAHNDKVTLMALIVFGVVLCMVLAAYGILLTHKIAGPLHKVSMYLDHIKAGRLNQVYELRKGDELVEFFNHFKAAHDALRSRTEQDIVLFDKAIAALGEGEVCEELKAARAEKAGSLK